MNPGDKYKASLKFSPIPTAISLGIAMLISMGIGVLYAIITSINPIIYLNFLILAGLVFAFCFITLFAQAFNKSRNKIVDTIFVFILCFTAWGAHWAYIQSQIDSESSFFKNLFDIPNLISFIGKYLNRRNLSVGSIGSSGTSIDSSILMLCYLAEFVAFMVPIYFNSKSKNYYCESCNVGYVIKTLHFIDTSLIKDNLTKVEEGDLGFLKGTIFYHKLNELPIDAKEKPTIGILDFSYCMACNQNSIINIKTVKIKLGEKAELEQREEQYYAEDIYVTDSSARHFLAYNYL